jgi:hypothetical protein
MTLPNIMILYAGSIMFTQQLLTGTVELIVYSKSAQEIYLEDL